MIPRVAGAYDRVEPAERLEVLPSAGVRNLGVTEPDDFFTDHLDLRPTMLYLAGVADDYQSDGRVILELLDHNSFRNSLYVYPKHFGTLGRSTNRSTLPSDGLRQVR